MVFIVWTVERHDLFLCKQLKSSDLLVLATVSIHALEIVFGSDDLFNLQSLEAERHSSQNLNQDYLLIQKLVFFAPFNALYQLEEATTDLLVAWCWILCWSN
eukprot:TRINITY_DN17928_c0_g1_i1.p1 TRINITY_DN17928_c0_g1~~TRINITY_DN17928_c0_g1_i1.p1  ORF type:complete len:102 (+),score=15.02 TRINITY_DN17928_c0_g1_i1:139-444(+)